MAIRGYWISGWVVVNITPKAYIPDRSTPVDEDFAGGLWPGGLKHPTRLASQT
jgi:hypothetical protein